MMDGKPQRPRTWQAAIMLMAAMISACSSTPQRHWTTSDQSESARNERFELPDAGQREQIVLSAFSLLDTGYRFGGRNPEAGLDCSGMVSFVVEQVSGQRLPHNAAKIAARTRPIPREALEAGDLVFFNTQGKAHSHMGIYIGDGRFIHAPSSRGKVRVELMDNRYFATRFDGARTLLEEDTRLGSDSTY